MVAEQLRRLAGIEREVTVEAVPGDVDGLRWRTRTRFAHLPDGGTAMRKHRSHELVAVDDCLIARPGAADRRGSRSSRRRAAARVPGRRGRLLAGAPRGAAGAGRDRAGDAATRSRGSGCWTCTPASGCSPPSSRTRRDRPTWWRSRATPARPGTRPPTCRAAYACSPATSAGCCRERLDEPFDLVVLDPPREGARRAVVEQVADRAPRAVGVRRLRPGRPGPRRRGLRRAAATRCAELRAFDLFPMTHHVECVALLTRD